MPEYLPHVLTIAGSDSGGGAGIQADLKTVTALGCYGTSAVTALTAQNTTGVKGVHPAPPEFVKLQIETVAEDIRLDACKTGMLANRAIVEAVVESLADLTTQNLVVDPVLRAQSGDPLLEREAEATVRNELLPLARIVTPNLPEAAALGGIDVSTPEEMKEAAEQLAGQGPDWALVKGGHLAGEPVDVLSDGAETLRISRPRVDTRNTHGTGCTYSSAIAARLAQGLSVPRAVEVARDDLQRGLEHALSIGSGRGPLGPPAMFRMSRDRP